MQSCCSLAYRRWSMELTRWKVWYLRWPIQQLPRREIVLRPPTYPMESRVPPIPPAKYLAICAYKLLWASTSRRGPLARSKKVH